MVKPLPEDARELRRLKFSFRLQIIATIFFFGAAIIGGVSIGWGFIPFMLFALGLANIALLIMTRKEIASRTKSK